MAIFYIFATIFQDYIGSLNWKFRLTLKDNGITYLNKYGELIDNHTVKVSTNGMDA